MIEAAGQYETTAHKVRTFLANELALPPDQINLTSRLRQDLKMQGGDAADIIEAFSLTFDVDITYFRANDYFGPGIDINPALATILWVFGNGKPLKTLTVKDLILSVEKGRLP